MAKRSTTDLQMPFCPDILLPSRLWDEEENINKYIFAKYFLLWLLNDHGLGWCFVLFLNVYFSPWPKLFSLEMFQQYTVNISPLWNSSGKFCNLRKHLQHLTDVSVGLQTGDQKHTVNIFFCETQKELVICTTEYICNDSLEKSRFCSHAFGLEVKDPEAQTYTASDSRAEAQ